MHYIGIENILFTEIAYEYGGAELLDSHNNIMQSYKTSR